MNFTLVLNRETEEISSLWQKKKSPHFRGSTFQLFGHYWFGQAWMLHLIQIVSRFIYKTGRV